MYTAETESLQKNMELARTKSAYKIIPSYKKQFNFLFKEDIFD